MANYYVDSASGSNANNGTTQALAWATIEYALESGGLAAGDNVWIRRGHSEIPITDITPIYDGTADSPISTIGWPRAAIPSSTITSADWTNGNALVDNVVGITPSRSQHTGRYCTAPDGKQYLITAIIWEAGVDGMAAGAEFAVGEILTNTTQTKKGKVWGFTDNLDTTGTLQYVRDSSSAWIDNDNITSDGGGDAEIDVGGETAVGFLIDREYSGSTVTGVSGLFQIEADDDYASRPTDIDGWDSDTHNLPKIDFNSTAFQINMGGDNFHVFKNLELLDSADANGAFYINYSGSISLIGMLISTRFNVDIISISGTYHYMERVIIEGSGAGISQHGITFTDSSFLYYKEGAIFNCGGVGFEIRGTVICSNVNSGVEISNGRTEIFKTYKGGLHGRDVRLGGTNGYIAYTIPHRGDDITIENYQKILGNHKTWYLGGELQTVDVGDTNAPSVADATGKTTNLMEILPNTSGYEFIEDWAVDVFTGDEDSINGARTYTLYIQNNMGVTLNGTTAKDDIWLKAEYVEQYDDDSEYVMSEAFSTETNIAQRADDTDWDTLTVSVTTATSSKVRLTLYVSKYVASGGIYVGGIGVS